MVHAIQVRDIARDDIHQLGPEEPVLRVPYDLFRLDGAVQKRGALVEWSEGGHLHHATVAPARLGDINPGERVLLKLPPQADDDPPQADDEWWLCDVEAVDGAAATQ